MYKESLGLWNCLSYLKRDIKFRAFLIALGLLIGTHLLISDNLDQFSLSRFKEGAIFMIIIICVFIPWHLFDKED
ncbi:hypothetical protein CXF79_10800 [Colwellia sp. Bg11-28]|uniref:Uncharacterized protein n=1 Tax=Colwellia psychrerythraea (strain 34H / ATCC BAA-681) TaxID=167879 RepID=Q47ZE9_COLP3|nr:hypothetical protein CPS_3124 [Colwellia psychrerythraea 34H]PKH87172.1 hypothetical protein CXF79_10800 [Colwellia sp. Bg11-28]